ASLEGEERMFAGVPAAQVEELATSPLRPLGAGVDEERAGLELTPGVRRAAQVVVSEAPVGEEERTANRLVVAPSERDPEALAQPSGERAVVHRREEVELIRFEPPHGAVVDRAEGFERVVAGRPVELQLSPRDCQVRLTAFGHSCETPRVLVDPARIDRNRRAVLADLQSSLVHSGQLFGPPEEGVEPKQGAS